MRNTSLHISSRFNLNSDVTDAFNLPSFWNFHQNFDRQSRTSNPLSASIKILIIVSDIVRRALCKHILKRLAPSISRLLRE